MVTYTTWRVEELKEFIKINNIRTARPSGKWGGLIRKDYIAVIKSIIPCEWLLVGSVERCGRPSSLGGNIVHALHRGRIRDGKSIPAPCTKCEMGTNTQSRLCTRCAGSKMNEHLKRVEVRSRKYYSSVMEELVRCK